MTKVWKVSIGPQMSTDYVEAKTIDEAIAKVRKANVELLKMRGHFIDGADLIAESEY